MYTENTQTQHWISFTSSLFKKELKNKKQRKTISFFVVKTDKSMSCKFVFVSFTQIIAHIALKTCLNIIHIMDSLNNEDTKWESYLCILENNMSHSGIKSILIMFLIWKETFFHSTALLCCLRWQCKMLWSSIITCNLENLWSSITCNLLIEFQMINIRIWCQLNSYMGVSYKLSISHFVP